jgi:hypothetical protein
MVSKETLESCATSVLDILRSTALSTLRLRSYRVYRVRFHTPEFCSGSTSMQTAVGTLRSPFSHVLSALILLSGGAAESFSAYKICKDTCDGRKHRRQELNKGLIHLTEERHTNGCNNCKGGVPEHPLEGSHHCSPYFIGCNLSNREPVN